MVVVVYATEPDLVRLGPGLVIVGALVAFDEVGDRNLILLIVKNGGSNRHES